MQPPRRILVPYDFTGPSAIGADLVVMGTQGRRGIARALFGSVAAHVLRTGSVPVVTVPEHVALSRRAADDLVRSPSAAGGVA